MNSVHKLGTIFDSIPISFSHRMKCSYRRYYHFAGLSRVTFVLWKWLFSHRQVKLCGTACFCLSHHLRLKLASSSKDEVKSVYLYVRTRLTDSDACDRFSYSGLYTTMSRISNPEDVRIYSVSRTSFWVRYLRWNRIHRSSERNLEAYTLELKSCRC